MQKQKKFKKTNDEKINIENKFNIFEKLKSGKTRIISRNLTVDQAMNEIDFLNDNFPDLSLRIEIA